MLLLLGYLGTAMRKLFRSINTLNNERGFLFPYTVFIATLLLLATITAISLLDGNQKTTVYQMEQIELETLRQMSYASLEQEWINGNLTLPFSSKNYQFPNGEATIFYQSHDEKSLYLSIKTITTKHAEKLWLVTIPLSLEIPSSDDSP